MNNTRFSIIGLYLAVAFLTLDFVQLQFDMGYEDSWSAYLEVDSLEVTVRYLLMVTVYVFVFLIAYFVFERKFVSLHLHWNFIISRKLIYVNNISLLGLSFLAIYNLSTIYNYGLLKYMIEVRGGLISLGGLYYFSTIGLLTSLLCSISLRSKNSIFYFSLLIFTVLVLASGFRNFLVFLIIYWYSFYHLSTRNIINIRILATTFAIIFAFYGFQYFRTEGFVGAHVIDILNRTAPLSHTFVSDLNSSLFAPHLIFLNYGLPLATLFSKLTGFDFSNWNEVVVNEAVFRDYLNWRGDPYARATGFAINHLVYGYFVGGYIGLLLNSIMYILTFLLGFLVLGSSKHWICGLIIICAIFMGIVDSSIEAFILMQYILVYYGFLIFTSKVIKKL